MFWFFLVMSFISGVRMQYTNVVDIVEKQLEVQKLFRLEEKIANEMKNYFSRVGDPQKWLQQNNETIQNHSGLLKKLKEDVSSGKMIFNDMQAFVERTSTILPPRMQSENERSEGIMKMLLEIENRTNSIGAVVAVEESWLAAARKQQSASNEKLDRAQTRLVGLRGDADALKKREGELEQQLKDLLNTAHQQKLQFEDIQEEKRKAEEQVKYIMRSVDETKKAIEQATNELQRLKISRKVATPTAAPGVNFVKSVKTASGKGKHVSLTVLSD